MSPTQRTLAHLRKLGYLAGIVERWNPHAKVRQDLFGFVDIVAVREGGDTFFIQCTSGSNHSARVAKIRASEDAATVMACGNVVEVWSWSKKGPRGKRKKWELRRERIT